MSESLTLLILAAGLGSRFGGFKQISPVGPNGEVILDYSIFDAMRAGFNRIVMVIRPELEESLREHFAKYLPDHIQIDFVLQKMDDLPEGFTLPPDRMKPWGTTHAVLAARHVIEGPFGVVNADDFYGADSYRVLADNLRELPLNTECLVGFQLMKTLSTNGSVSRGICQADDQGNLTEVVEHTKIEHDEAGGARSLLPNGKTVSLDPSSIVSMNMWGFGPEVMADFQRLFGDFLRERIGEAKSEFYIPSAVDSLIKSGRSVCRVSSSSSQWFGITYPEDKQETVESIQKLIEAGVYPKSLTAKR